MKEFKDKVAVVTGAASGIGRSLVETFIEAGMKVVLADIERENLARTTQKLKDSGADVKDVVIDVSEPDQIEMLAQTTIDTYGAVHILCNNAGVAHPGNSKIWEIPLEDWQWIIGINLMGVINGVRVFLPIMLEQNCECHIVNTASISGLIVNPVSVPYGVTKHGVVVFSEALHLNLQTNLSKVKVSVLCPGNVNTDIFNSTQRLRTVSIPALSDPTGEEVMIRRVTQLFLERGMEPLEVARQVYNAIKEERFYIITHDFNSPIEKRMLGILNKTNPEQAEPS